MTPTRSRGQGKGIELEYADWAGKGGGGTGRPLVAVHGLTANLRCFDVIASALAPGRRVIAYDLRGRGLSDKPPKGYSIDHHVADLLELINHLELPMIDLIGHSLGASIVLAFAARHPDRVAHLILFDGAGKLTKAQTGRVFAGIKPSLERLGKTFPSFDNYLEHMQATPFLKPWNDTLTEYFRHEIQDTENGVRSRVLPSAITEEIMNLVKFDPARHYPRLRCPTLILRAPLGMLAKNDILLPKGALKKMIGTIPRVWLIEIPDTNHYSIIFQSIPARDQAINLFLDT